uniref:Uncharacterized protein n=2 Tax=Quercus lobata TaxID=97700 RepID=A0A7N2MM05_QUELO
MQSKGNVNTEPNTLTNRPNKCLSCGAPVNAEGTPAAHSEGHSSGPSQRDNEGASGSRGTRSSWWDDLKNWLNRFLANPGYLFLVFLFAFMSMFAIFMAVFLGLFVIVYFK